MPVQLRVGRSACYAVSEGDDDGFAEPAGGFDCNEGSVVPPSEEKGFTGVYVSFHPPVVFGDQPHVPKVNDVGCGVVGATAGGDVRADRVVTIRYRFGENPDSSVLMLHPFRG